MADITPGVCTRNCADRRAASKASKLCSHMIAALSAVPPTLTCRSRSGIARLSLLFGVLLTTFASLVDVSLAQRRSRTSRPFGALQGSGVKSNYAWLSKSYKKITTMMAILSDQRAFYRLPGGRLALNCVTEGFVIGSSVLVTFAKTGAMINLIHSIN